MAWRFHLIYYFRRGTKDLGRAGLKLRWFVFWLCDYYVLGKIGKIGKIKNTIPILVVTIFESCGNSLKIKITFFGHIIKLILKKRRKKISRWNLHTIGKCMLQVEISKFVLLCLYSCNSIIIVIMLIYCLISFARCFLSDAWTTPFNSTWWKKEYFKRNTFISRLV